MTEPRTPSAPRLTALETRLTEDDGRRFSPSAARNRDAICEIFLAHVLRAGRVLEIASGTGEHGVHITAAAGSLSWTFSDPDPDARASIAAWIAHESRANLAGPLALDVTQPDWTVHVAATFDALACINMMHISPFAASEGLLHGAGRLLPSGGRLFLYGPFAREGVMAPSNASFSDSLRARHPEWGVRDLDREVLPVARAAGLTLREIVAMPANNLSVILERA